MAKRKQERITVGQWSAAAESVWIGLADWRAAHPKATFSEIEAALDERLNAVRARVLADLALASRAADLQGASAQEGPCCAQCGSVLRARGERDRTLLTQGGAEVRLQRTYATCPECGDGTFPLDDERELLPGTLTPWLQASLARLGSWMPFAHAASELGRLSRAPGEVLVRESVAERLTEAAGAASVAEQTAAVEALERRPTPEPSGPTVLQMSADGAMISLVGKPWAEVKTVAIGTVVTTPTSEPGAQEPSSFSRRADHPTFRRLALVETSRRGVGPAGVVVAVQDGADWLQGFVDVHRRDAVRVLDFPHPVEYLTRAGHAALGLGLAATPAAKAWLAEQAHALKHDGPTPVLAAVRALPPGEHRAAARAYLEPRLAQIQSPSFRAAGYPIGSGLVEAANKIVVQDRLKGSGIHWAPASVDPLLAVRTVVCADRWDEAWPQISARLPADACARRRQLRAERRAAPEAAQAAAQPHPPRPAAPPSTPPSSDPPAPKTIVDGRPTKAHPWHRHFLPHRADPPARN